MHRTQSEKRKKKEKDPEGDLISLSFLLSFLSLDCLDCSRQRRACWRDWQLSYLKSASMEALTSPSIRRFVAYYRVSTARQGRSGLGLEAQKAAVLAFINGNAELVAEFTEVESGKHADREQLKKAIAACKKHKAKLVIAKLDRLSRNLRGCHLEQMLYFGFPKSDRKSFFSLVCFLARSHS
jgi:hypothetical protein